MRKIGRQTLLEDEFLRNKTVNRGVRNCFFVLLFLNSMICFSQPDKRCDFEQASVNYLVDSVLQYHQEMKHFCVSYSDDNYEVKLKSSYSLMMGCDILKDYKSYRDSVLAENSNKIDFRLDSQKIIDMNKLLKSCDTAKYRDKEIYTVLSVSSASYIENSALVLIELKNHRYQYGYALVFKFEDKDKCAPELNCIIDVAY